MGRQLADSFHDLFDDDRCQTLARLVNQQQEIVGHQRASDGQHLLLSTGEIAPRKLDQPLEVRKDPKDEIGPLCQVALVAFRDFEVLLYAQVAENGPMFGDVPNALGSNLVGGLTLYLFAVEGNAALARRCEAENGLERGRLASSVPPQQRGNAPLRHLERDAFQDVEQIRNRGDKTIMLVEHKMDLVMNVSDWITVMHQGQVLAEGTPAEIAANEVVQSAYLGELYGDLSEVR